MRMHRVVFIEKSGKSGSASFPTLHIATMYARTVKSGKVVEGGTDELTSVAVVKCEAPEIVNAKRQILNESILREHAAEAYMEAGTETRLLGGSTSEALDNASSARAQVMRNLCACGKSCPIGMSVCYSCRRYR
jgi:hypothetical protein